MKLILTQELPDSAATRNIVEVKDGYGRSYLLPRGLAIGWTEAGRSRSPDQAGP